LHRQLIRVLPVPLDGFGLERSERAFNAGAFLPYDPENGEEIVDAILSRPMLFDQKAPFTSRTLLFISKTCMFP
jgi:hypothetical protein